jgi:chromate transporter
MLATGPERRMCRGLGDEWLDHVVDPPRRTSRREADLLPLGEATRTWFAISLQTFGGPAGQIAVMQHHLVDEKRWIGQQRFLHAMNYCMLLPGPEAQQLAIYIGWLLNGTAGGLIAGTLFVLPGVVALLALSFLYVGLGDTLALTALFAGLAPAVIAIVVQAVHRVGKRSLHNPVLVALAVSAFVALVFAGVPFPVVVLAAGVIGLLFGPRLTASRAKPMDAGGLPPLLPDDALHHATPSTRRSVVVVVVGLALWFAPILWVATAIDSTDVFLDQGLFFSGAAVVTFGGAYAVLTYVAQQAVDVYGWLTPGEMVRGLALAETTPGPLIMVVQFVAFVGAYRQPGDLDPWTAAVLASLLVTWVTFVPCFLFVLLGAAYVERLRANQRLGSALAGISAAVVGVIATLAVFFAVHTLFGQTERWTAGPLALELPVLSSWHPQAFALTALALGLIFGLRWSPLRTLAACGVVGAVVTILSQ